MSTLLYTVEICTLQFNFFVFLEEALKRMKLPLVTVLSQVPKVYAKRLSPLKQCLQWDSKGLRHSIAQGRLFVTEVVYFTSGLYSVAFGLPVI